MRDVKYYGWIHKEPNPGFKDTWVATVKFDRDGKELHMPMMWRDHSAGVVIDKVEDYLDHRITLDQTLNAELGFWIRL